MITNASDPVHFLLVDDLDENLLALEALLRRDGLVLLKARSGPDALELLLKHEVALALIDIQMPDMDGLELAELMRGPDRTRRVPIIFLTAGSADRQRRFRGYEAGAVDFLHKPLEPDVLRSKTDVFFELFRQRQEVARQRDELKAATEENARLLEESRRYAEALKEADRRKDEFLAILAHELRNPLAPISNALQVWPLVEKFPEEAERVREMMGRQVGQMVRLIDDLLDVSRIARGRIELKKERIDLASAIEGALDSVRPFVDACGHELTVRLPEQPIVLYGDPGRLIQVFGNLIHNAAKYTGRDGHILVAAKLEGSTVVVSVRDDGPGIPREMLARIFEMFSQVDQTLDRAHGGLGIGLTLVKTLIELHDGSVEAFSEGLGRGSEFVVRLPLEQAPPEPATPAVAPSAALRRRRVLVVDDMRPSADTLAMMLRKLDQETQAVYDGRSALAAVERFTPDIVICDIAMPGMDGYEVAGTIRRSKNPHPLLVALTGYGQEDDCRRAIEAGFDHHLVKPASLDALRDILTRTA